MFNQQTDHLHSCQGGALARYLLGAAVCWLALLIVVVHLDASSMWGDEEYTWRYSRQGPFSLIQAQVTLDVHPPGHYLWAWAWMTWMQSDNLFVIRLSSAFAGVLAVAFCYRMGLTWFGSRWAGLAGALFLATSGIFVFYARELRIYALLPLVTCLSWWYLWRLVQQKRGSFWGYAASVGLMAYTYYLTAFVALAQFMFTAAFYRRQLSSLLLAFSVALVAFLPWLPVIPSQLSLTKAQSGRNELLIAGPVATKPTSLGSINEFLHFYSAGQPTFALLLVTLAVVLGLSVPTSKTYRRWLIAAGLWLFLIGLVFAVNLFIPVYSIRYVYYLIPALALLAGVAVDRLPNSWARAALTSVIVISGLLTQTEGFPMNKAPHRELLQTVAQRYLPGDRIWYNMTVGARGSWLNLEVAYHLQYDAPQLDSDIFVWAAPSDYADQREVRRVWDIRPYWLALPAWAADEMLDGRELSEEHEINGYFVRLYEAPPLQQSPSVFGELFDLLVSPQDRESYHPGEEMTLKTWWRVQETPSHDYSYGLYLRGPAPANDIVAQADAGLQIDRVGSAQWQASDTYRLVTLAFQLPAQLTAGDYQLWLGVYYWEHPTRLAIQATSEQLVDNDLALVRVAQIRVE